MNLPMLFVTIFHLFLHIHQHRKASNHHANIPLEMYSFTVKLYISRGRLAWWLLAFLHSVRCASIDLLRQQSHTSAVLIDTHLERRVNKVLALILLTMRLSNHIMDHIVDTRTKYSERLNAGEVMYNVRLNAG